MPPPAIMTPAIGPVIMSAIGHSFIGINRDPILTEGKGF